MEQTKNQIRQKLTKQEGWISIIVNIILFGFKYYAGIVSGSLALVADAWHTLSDSISSIFVLISARYSFKKPDKEHPFGHGRFELITSIFIGILLILIAIGFIKEGITKFVSKEEAHFGAIAIVATIVSILMKEGLAQYAFWGYRITKSDTLKADGWHHRSDSISSVVILVGIFIGRYIWWIDALLSVIVAFFLMYTAYEIIKNSISCILGEEASDDLIAKVEKLSNQLAGREIYAHHLHLHNYVTHQEMTFHIRLPNELNIFEAHLITNSIEIGIKEELNIEATIHIDPLQK
ncbi:MAG: cation diffusion facilitator family transporter [Prolixibacteraceae bacterium]